MNKILNVFCVLGYLVTAPPIPDSSISDPPIPPLPEYVLCHDAQYSQKRGAFIAVPFFRSSRDRTTHPLRSELRKKCHAHLNVAFKVWQFKRDPGTQRALPFPDFIYVADQSTPLTSGKRVHLFYWTETDIEHKGGQEKRQEDRGVQVSDRLFVAKEAAKRVSRLIMTTFPHVPTQDALRGAYPKFPNYVLCKDRTFGNPQDEGAFIAVPWDIHKNAMSWACTQWLNGEHFKPCCSRDGDLGPRRDDHVYAAGRAAEDQEGEPEIVLVWFTRTDAIEPNRLYAWKYTHETIEVPMLELKQYA